LLFQIGKEAIERHAGVTGRATWGGCCGWFGWTCSRLS
jgi:hypothetical protein